MTLANWHTVSVVGMANNFIVALGCVLGALFVSLYSSVHSGDAEEYRHIYNSIVFDGVPVDSFPRRETLYYLWNKAVGALGVPFEGYLFISTLIFLPLKLMAFRRLSHGVGLVLIFCIYISIYFFLHDSIQYKISWALALAAWACVSISRKQFLRATAWTVLAVGFHITSVLLPLTFFLARFILRSPEAKLAFVLVLMLLYQFADFLVEAVVHVTGLYDPRYFDYLDSQLLDEQNKSGLFYPYVLLMAIFVVYTFVGASKIDSKQLRAQAFVLCVSVGILLLFENYVSVAARLSDVLGVLLAPVLAALFVQPSKQNWHQKGVIFAFCAAVLLFRLRYLWGFEVLRLQMVQFGTNYS